MDGLGRRGFLAFAAAGVLSSRHAAGEQVESESMTTDTSTSQTSYALTRPAYVGHAHLLVQDLASVSAYYQQAIGLKVLETSASGVVLGAGGRPLLTLTTRGDAARAPRSAAGLFHTAFLMPNRTELGRWLVHAAQTQVPLDGASDHLVSEALYLHDPEGNGIEIYADRPHEQWQFKLDGTVEMATLGLDLQAIYDEAPKDRWDGMVDGTAIGHIHLQVGDIPKADAFYRDVLGLTLMTNYPGASFYATGNYHHHVAANIWNSRGAQARAGNMAGLSDYTLRFNDKAALDAAVSALDGLEIPSVRDGDVWSLKDPWGIGLKLTA